MSNQPAPQFNIGDFVLFKSDLNNPEKMFKVNMSSWNALTKEWDYKIKQGEEILTVGEHELSKSN